MKTDILKIAEEHEIETGRRRIEWNSADILAFTARLRAIRRREAACRGDKNHLNAHDQTAAPRS